jgi:hypothetical protein
MLKMFFLWTVTQMMDSIMIHRMEHVSLLVKSKLQLLYLKDKKFQTLTNMLKSIDNL